MHWLERNMSHAELAEWAAFFAIEPFGPRREELRAGRIAATIANAIPRRGGEPFHAEDFFAELGDQAAPELKPVQSKEEQIAILKMWVTATGATPAEEPAAASTPRPEL